MRSLSITLALSMALGAGFAGTAWAQDTRDHGWGALLADGHEDEDHGALPMLARVVADDGFRLGVKVRDTADGLQVTEVEDGTLAASAGVKANDLVLRIGETRIENTADVKRALAAYGPGDEVPVSVVREGRGIVKLEGTVPSPHEHEDEAENTFFRSHSGGAFLGITMGDSEDGVLIEEVVTESSAWFAGLAEGDVLQAVDGEALSDPSEVADAVSSREVGAFVKLTYERDGESRTVRARLGSKRPRIQMFGRAPGRGGMRVLPGRSFAVPGNMRMQMHDLFDGEQLEELLHEHMKELEDGQLRMHMPKGKGMGGMDDVHQWIQKIDGGDAQSLKIRIEDGVMTIEKNGEVETYSLDDAQDGNTFEWASSPRSRSTEDA